MEKQTYNLISEIVERADREKLLLSDTLTLFMDIENVHNDIGLRLEDLLNAGYFDFGHDLLGIQQNFNRQTKQLENCFLPRLASKPETKEAGVY